MCAISARDDWIPVKTEKREKEEPGKYRNISYQTENILATSCPHYKQDKSVHMGIPGIYSYMVMYEYKTKLCGHCGNYHKLGSETRRTY
jgi:hypothetical protein